MKNREIAHLLYEIADFLEIQDVEYKPRAYRDAARTIETMSEDVEDVYERGELEDIEGVGESIASKLREYLETGELAYYQDLKSDLPIDIEAVTSVRGVGPKTAKRLYLDLGVTDLDDLEEAAREGEIAALEGFGERSQQNILENIELAKRSRERMLLGNAFPIATDLADRLRAAEAFDRVQIVGSFRRRRPTVGDIDVLGTASDRDRALDAFCGQEDVEEVLSRGPTKATVLAAGDVQIDLRLVEPDEFGAANIYFTGSADHNVALRERAIERDWKLNEYGLFDVSDVPASKDEKRAGDRIASETEEAVYDALGLDWIPPALREATDEIQAAASGDLPDLVEEEDVCGDLQVHTDYSDGSAALREMVAAADERGDDYLLVTDHGPGAPIPSRMDADEFFAQREAVDEFNDSDEFDVTVLQGVEAEITDDGLGTPDDWLTACDLVVAALHSRPENPTERVLAAIETGHVDVLGHPTNRLLNEREPLDLDLDRVASAAARENVAIEVNAQPARLDLDWEAVKSHRGDVSFVVSTDAHETSNLDYRHLGVAQLRRGWCEPADVRNTRPLSDLLDSF